MFNNLKSLRYGVLFTMVLFTLSNVVQPQHKVLAATITVNTTDDELNTDGDCSLREAIRAANLNMTIDACPAGEAGSTDTIQLTAGATYFITIAGAGENSSATGDFDITNNAATIDVDLQVAGGGTAIIDANDIDRVLDILSGAQVTITGVTLTDGTAQYGGIIYNSGTLTLNSSTVSDGNAPDGSSFFANGGGIYNSGGVLTLNASTVTGNVTSGFNAEGGGIYNDDGIVTVQNNSLIISNLKGGIVSERFFSTVNITIDASTISNNSGGGIRNIDGTLTVQNNSVITQNTGSGIRTYSRFSMATSNLNSSDVSSNDGTGISNEGGTINVQNTSITSNTIGISSGSSTSYTANVTIINSTISSNQNLSGGSGAGLYNTATMTIQNSLIGGSGTGNITNGWGGGIYNIGTLTVSDSTISHNSSLNGGGSYNGGTLILNNTSVSENSSSANGGGIYNSHNLTIQNNSSITSNTGVLGGGIANIYSGFIPVSILDASTVNENIASSGAGIYTTGGTVTIQNNSLIGGIGTGNTANDLGGGIYNIGGVVNVTGSRILDNSAGQNGGAIANSYNSANAISMTGSCLVDNSNTAFYNSQPALQTATGNWWGTSDGPGPVGPGSGDTVSTNVDYSGFLSAPILGCPNKTLPTPLVASAVCVNENLVVTISAGDGPFNITASAGVNTPVNGVSVGMTTINGPEKWDDLTVTETGGDMQSINLGQFRCRSDERPVPLNPAHRAHTTNPFPTFSWTGISNASNYRIFVFDDAVVANRTVDIRQNSSGPTSMTLTTPLPNGRLFWRVRGRQNRLWSLWSVRFTLFKDPAPSIELNPSASGGSSQVVPLPTMSAVTTPVPVAPPNAR